MGTSSSGSEASRLSKHCRFMQHWLKLYPWVTIEGSGVVYCRDYKRAMTAPREHWMKSDIIVRDTLKKSAEGLNILGKFPLQKIQDVLKNF